MGSCESGTAGATKRRGFAVSRLRWTHGFFFVIGVAIPALFLSGFLYGTSWQSGEANPALRMPSATQAPATQAPAIQAPAIQAPATQAPATAAQPATETTSDAQEPRPSGKEESMALPGGIAGAARPYVSGNATNSPVTFAVVEDFTCPYCADFESKYGSLLQAAADQGKIQLRRYVVDFFGQGSTDAANAAACASDQGRFSQYAALLYRDQKPDHGGMSTTEFVQLGKEAAVPDLPAFEKCLTQQKYAAYVASVTAAARASNARSTPGLFLDGANFMLPSEDSTEFLNSLIDRAVSYAQETSGVGPPAP